MDRLERSLRELLTDDRLDVPVRPGAVQSVHDGVRRRRRRRTTITSVAASVAVVAGGAAALDASGIGGPDQVVPGGDRSPGSSISATDGPNTESADPLLRPRPSATIGWNDLPYDDAAAARYPGTVPDPAVAWCKAPQLVASTALQGGGGAAVGPLIVHNNGATCALQGAPSVAGVDLSGATIALPRAADPFVVNPWIRLGPGSNAISQLTLTGLAAHCVGTVVSLTVGLGHGSPSMSVPAMRAGDGQVGLLPVCNQGGSADHYDVVATAWQTGTGAPQLANSGLQASVVEQDRTVRQGSILRFQVELDTSGRPIDPCLPFREQLVLNDSAATFVASEDHMLDCRAIAGHHGAVVVLDMQLRVPTNAPVGNASLRWETPIAAVQTAGIGTVHIVAAPPQCRQSQLSLGTRALGPIGMHEQEMTVVFTNTSRTTCSLRGYPGVEFADQSGRRLPTQAVDALTFPWPGAAVATVVLPARGGTASFALAGPTSDKAHAGGCPATGGFRVIAPALTHQVLLSASWPYCNKGLVDVSPVVPGSRGPN